MSARTPELADTLVEGLTNGIPLRQLCRDHGISKSEVYRWFEDDPELQGRIARARVMGFDEIAEEALEIADTPIEGVEYTTKADGSTEEKRGDMLGHRKLQIETRLKLLAKWDPKRYGERLGLEHSGTVSIGERLKRAEERLKGG
jgi:hypothetical protein